jgi:hypothetical protein
MNATQAAQGTGNNPQQFTDANPEVQEEPTPPAFERMQQIFSSTPEERINRVMQAQTNPGTFLRHRNNATKLSDAGLKLVGFTLLVEYFFTEHPIISGIKYLGALFLALGLFNLFALRALNRNNN